MNMENEVNLMWIYAAVAELILLLYFVLFKLREDGRNIIWKSITSTGFVLLGAAAFIRLEGNAYYWLIVAGLILGSFGDVFLVMQYHRPAQKELYFLLGLGAFTFGHISYVLAFSQADLLQTGCMLLVCGFLSILLVKLLQHWQLQFGSMTIAVVLYCTIILLMEWQALLLLPSMRLCYIILNIGTVLFVFSDLILAFIYFRDMDTIKMNRWNLLCYYLAQLMIAAHLYLL